MEMKFLRRREGCILYDHRCNEEILEELKVDPFGVNLKKKKKNKSNLLRHITGMNNTGIPKVVLNYRSNG
jgi:hypothetical protein